MTDLETLCREVCLISKTTGDFIRKELNHIRGGDIEVKGNHDFVTYVDKTAEQQLVQALESLLPEAGFIAEEKTATRKGERYNWVIDPLDGTTNFIHGLPCFSISIALMRDQQVILGVVYEINQDECFYAWEGSPAFLNDKRIQVSSAPQLKDSLLATGFPYYDYSRLEKYLQLFSWCLHNTHGVRRLGSAAVDLAYVAAGRFDGFFEYSLNPWDVAAGSFLVQQAGGRVSDFQGENHYIFGREIMASNALIFEEFLDKTRGAFSV